MDYFIYESFKLSVSLIYYTFKNSFSSTNSSSLRGNFAVRSISLNVGAYNIIFSILYGILFFFLMYFDKFGSLEKNISFLGYPVTIIFSSGSRRLFFKISTFFFDAEGVTK